MPEAYNKKLPQIVTAHSGFAAAGGVKDKSEDNTLDNIIKALNHAPDAIEIDVHYIDTDGDGKPETLWLGHDNADPAINPSAEDVLLLLLGRHPRAAEVHRPTDRVRIQFDLKSVESVFAVVELADRVGFALDRLFIAGDVPYDFVLQNRELLLPFLEKGLELWMSPRGILGLEEDVDAMGDLDVLLQKLHALELPNIIVNAEYCAITDEIKARLDAEGFPVSIWTLNSPELIAEHLERGMYNVTSRLAACLARRNALRDA